MKSAFLRKSRVRSVAVAWIGMCWIDTVAGGYLADVDIHFVKGGVAAGAGGGGDLGGGDAHATDGLHDLFQAGLPAGAAEAGMQDHVKRHIGLGFNRLAHGGGERALEIHVALAEADDDERRARLRR